MNSASAHNALRSLNSSAQVKLLGSMQTPPVPSLITTSNSSQKLSNGTPFHQLSSSNMPPLRPKLPSGSRSSHEIITIGDSPVTKNPPPLLPTPSTGLTGVQSHGMMLHMIIACYCFSLINKIPSIHIVAVSAISSLLPIDQ